MDDFGVSLEHRYPDYETTRKRDRRDARRAKLQFVAIIAGMVVFGFIAGQAIARWVW